MSPTISKVLQSLKRSAFRAKFRLGAKERAYLEEKGIDTIREHARSFILSRIAPALPKNDGKQTPLKGHPVFIAQHATATCCRSCIRKWHAIEKGRPLTEEEVHYVVEVIMAWIEGQRLSGLL
ncbi:MAG TPA: DUF4186 domain-containing protein [Thermodesulfobacteriota bacterium]|nr:DUF4186 domain-containing protein [Deltaproteobacteria bacterium]HNR14678.1 DUF4186 domain-containing protein [Thermodesulfobacteriota bacterium]HNU72943.1 DUF4186 domain-containing protein [Thermodesulfobacteriota bacterium]HOC37984.1 DUF4186 domain-containing protein [Thermodesulfobacteriota bacterium]HQO77678.1 DUF4186 domain-containing protein [Thermodesulfobacteriota bacterium]